MATSRGGVGSRGGNVAPGSAVGGCVMRCRVVGSSAFASSAAAAPGVACSGVAPCRVACSDTAPPGLPSTGAAVAQLAFPQLAYCGIAPFRLAFPRTASSCVAPSRVACSGVASAARACRCVAHPCGLGGVSGSSVPEAGCCSQTVISRRVDHIRVRFRLWRFRVVAVRRLSPCARRIHGLAANTG